VQNAAGTPSKWSVTLRASREIVEVWADSVGECDGDLVFSVLVDASPDEQADMEVTGRTPTNPARVIVTVARFPSSVVDDYRSA
jgi:hypothetical protein